MEIVSFFFLLGMCDSLNFSEGEYLNNNNNNELLKEEPSLMIRPGNMYDLTHNFLTFK